MKSLARLFRRGRSSSSTRRRPSRRLEVQVLEDRRVLSTSLTNGELLIQGDANVNHITLLRRGNDLVVQEAVSATAAPTEFVRAYDLVSSIRLLAGGGNDVINVKTIQADWNIPVTINGEGGYDHIFLSPTAHSLGNIEPAALTIDGGGTGGDGAWLVLYDQMNAFSSSYKITADAVDRPNGEAVLYSRISELDLYATETYPLGQFVPHHIDVESTAAGTHVNVHVGLAATQINVGRAADGLAGINGGVSLLGRGVQNQVNFNDQSNPAAGNYQLGSQSVTRVFNMGTATIHYDTVGPVTFNAGASADVFTVTTSAVAKAITLHGNGGADRVVGVDWAGTTFNLTGAAAGNLYNKVFFDSVQAVQGGGKADAFVFTPGQTFAGTIHGGGDTDFLVYTAFTTGVTVNLATNAIPGAAQGVTDVEGVIGSPYANKLIGDGRNNVLVGGDKADTLTGDAGRDLLIGGLGADILNGGDGDDILIGGTTSYDDYPKALAAILAEWGQTTTSPRTVAHYEVRIDRLQDRRWPGGFLYPLDILSVKDDYDIDTLTGGKGHDWFFTTKDSEIKDREKLTDGSRTFAEIIG